MSKIFLWGFNSMADKTLCTCACFETIPTETEQKILAGTIIVISKFNELFFSFCHIPIDTSFGNILKYTH